MPRFHDLIEGAAQASVVQVEPWLKGMVQPVLDSLEETTKPKVFKFNREEAKMLIAQAAQGWVTPLPAKEPQANPPEPRRGAEELQITQRTAKEEDAAAARGQATPLPAEEPQAKIGRAHV